MSRPERVDGLSLRQDGPLLDPFGRTHTYVRVSVTDRCNYRCTYCMPAEGLQWMAKDHLLTFEEITRIVAVLATMGVSKVRLTGGEPTVRRGIVDLVRMIASIGAIRDIAMTTNAHTLAKQAAALANAGLSRVNISIDAIDPDIFRAMTRGGDVARVLAGITAAREAGLTPIKLNCVVMRGVNDGEIERMVAHFAQMPDVQIRFIEYMPFDRVGREKHHIPAKEIRERLAGRYTLRPLEHDLRAGPARDLRIEETGQVVGFISPITEHFCDTCNRIRLQADGHLRTCLSREAAPSLRDLLRSGAGDRELASVLRERVWAKVSGHEADREDDGYTAFEGAMTSIGG